MKQALTNRTRMSALRKIQLMSGNSVDVRFATASRGDNTQWSIHVSSMNTTHVQEAVMILEQEKLAIEKLNLILKCEKKFRGAVIGKGGKGIRDIANTAGPGTRIDCVDAKGGFVITSFEKRALIIAQVNLEHRIEECSMLTNKRRSRQSKASLPSQRIFGSRFAFLDHYDVGDKAAEDVDEERPEWTPTEASMDSIRKHVGSSILERANVS